MKATPISPEKEILYPGQQAMAPPHSSFVKTMVFLTCFLSTFFGGIMSMLMSVYLPVAVKELLGEVSDSRMNSVSAWINSVFIFGWMFGGICWGLICDRIGRTRTVIFSTAFFGVFALLTAYSGNWVMVMICRFFTGFGIGGVLVTTTVLVTEIWEGKVRAIILGIVALAMPVGFFAAGIINNLTGDWHQAFKIGWIPIIIAMAGFFSMTESEKWKQSARAGKKNRQLIFDPLYKKNLVLGSIVFGTMLIGLWAVFAWAPTWVQSISLSEHIQEQRGNTMMILAGGGITGSFFSGWVVNALGLRKTMLLCFAACFLMTFVVFNLNNTISTLTFMEMALLAFFFGISQGALAVYIPSLFPTAICASATGFCFNVGRLFTGTVVFFIGALESVLGGYGQAVFIFSFIFVIGFIATFSSKDVQMAVDDKVLKDQGQHA